MGRCSKKSTKQLNNVLSIRVSLGLGLVLGLVPSSDLVCKAPSYHLQVSPEVDVIRNKSLIAVMLNTRASTASTASTASRTARPATRASRWWR